MEKAKVRVTLELEYEADPEHYLPEDRGSVRNMVKSDIRHIGMEELLRFVDYKVLEIEFPE